MSNLSCYVSASDRNMRVKQIETNVPGQEDCRGGVPAENDTCLCSKFACTRRLANISVALMYVLICIYAHKQL